MKLGEAVYKSQQNAKPDAAAKGNDKKDEGKKTIMLLMQTLKK